MSPRLRLLKVIVQPVFVVDDGTFITEQAAEPFSVAAVEWRSFADADGGFDRAIAAAAEAAQKKPDSPPET